MSVRSPATLAVLALAKERGPCACVEHGDGGVERLKEKIRKVLFCTCWGSGDDENFHLHTVDCNLILIGDLVN